jgi:hypothetical protein
MNLEKLLTVTKITIKLSISLNYIMQTISCKLYHYIIMLLCCFAGLTIQAPGLDGACPNQPLNLLTPGDSLSYTESRVLPVGFGYDISTGCIMALNRTEFENLCCEGTSSCAGQSEYADNSGIPYFLKPQEGYVIS